MLEPPRRPCAALRTIVLSARQDLFAFAHAVLSSPSRAIAVRSLRVSGDHVPAELPLLAAALAAPGAAAVCCVSIQGGCASTGGGASGFVGAELLRRVPNPALDARSCCCTAASADQCDARCSGVA